MLRRTHLLSVCDPAGQAKSRVDWKPARLIYVVLSFAILLIGIFPGCTEPTPPAEAFIWGRKGLDDGRFIKPRAISIDTSDQLYIVDMTSAMAALPFLTPITFESYFTPPKANCWKTKPSAALTDADQANSGS